MLRWRNLDQEAVTALLGRYGLAVRVVAPAQAIPGSYWGGSEAGLVGPVLFVRADTPLHSLLHEACHFICMDPARRAALHTDAGGDFSEEDAVCYLQILLAGELPGTSATALCADMDEWGYTFRLGSAARWFAEDAADACRWLQQSGLIHEDARPSFRVRGQA